MVGIYASVIISAQDFLEGTETNYFFDEFEVDSVKRKLLKRGQVVHLKPKTFDLLLTLIERSGEVLSKNALMDLVWENQFVEENNLTVHVAALRKALGELKDNHRFIITVPGRGYRFVGELNAPLAESKIIQPNLKTLWKMPSSSKLKRSNASRLKIFQKLSQFAPRRSGKQTAQTHS